MTDLIEVRVSNLVGAPLDWAVAMAEGFTTDPECRTTIWRGEDAPASVSIRGAAEGFGYRPSSNWRQGGQLIDKHNGTAQHIPGLPDDLHYAGGPAGAGVWCYGPTALIAFCRGLVNYKLGDTVQVPKELMPYSEPNRSTTDCRLSGSSQVAADSPKEQLMTPSRSPLAVHFSASPPLPWLPLPQNSKPECE